MNDNFIEFLKENFEHPEKMDPEQIRKIISETSHYFTSLQEIIGASDPKEREEAFAEALEIKRFLEMKAGLYAPFMSSEPSEDEQLMLNEINERLGPPSAPNRKTKKIKPIKMS